jgi:hypothetical protein
VLGFTAALAFLCDGSDDALEAVSFSRGSSIPHFISSLHPCQVLAATPSAHDIMSSLPPFSCVELKDSPTIVSCVIESGFYRGRVLKPRPSFAKVSLAVSLPVRATLGVARKKLAVKEAEVVGGLGFRV